MFMTSNCMLSKLYVSMSCLFEFISLQSKNVNTSTFGRSQHIFKAVTKATSWNIERRSYIKTLKKSTSIFLFVLVIEKIKGSLISPRQLRHPSQQTFIVLNTIVNTTVYLYRLGQCVQCNHLQKKSWHKKKFFEVLDRSILR